ncbi:NACHT domain-containing protein [Micromonospora sp. NPDC050276]|uniref:NACHT domain-containing protein n=1 Tax=Micromonospora sp. NPDC050276 TaxID=3364278 RepID=UPI00378EE5B4
MRATIRVVAPDINSKGDVLTRLAEDLFFTLGYDECRTNVSKAGREVDLIAQHRFEARTMVAECKNHARPIGGADTNKFAGVLDAERRKNPDSTIHGYFVSLSGFTSSAVEQELECGGQRFVMLDGPAVIAELAAGKIVISADRAASIAESTAAKIGLRMASDETAILVGHEGGWIWLIGLTSASRTEAATCFVHADGTPVAANIANDLLGLILSSDDNLTFAPPINLKLIPDSAHASTLRVQYLEFITKEFGAITLEGMPADQEVHSRQFKLENLYVPLTLSPAPLSSEPASDPEESLHGTDGPVEVMTEEEAYTEDEDDAISYDDEDAPQDDTTNFSLGEVVTISSRIAILGLPGSGKTTMLKRLAVAYASHDRLPASTDELPDKDWFPMLLRCRSLGTSVRQPIVNLLSAQAAQAELIDAGDAFQALISNELIAGRLLLLIDGLDEISSTGDRAAFVAQLRTFIGTYPNCTVVMTSREAGFRAVAAAVQPVCDAYRVRNLSDEAIHSLTYAWHAEVIGRTGDVADEASRLSESIISTDRVRRLAVNPLMLTTLLLVKRWVGQLPRKRTVLYQKAVEVLLMTWNVEGHEPLDQDETIPQLAYAAFLMMTQGATTVTATELGRHFADARRSMPELLGYARISVGDFISRVEERSSLLTLSGHKLINGELKPTYEFKHLTFQEYFAALAIVNGWLPQALQDRSPAEVLRGRLNSESWSEVVALTAVLAGKRASEIVQALLSPNFEDRPEGSLDGSWGRDASSARYSNILSCLVDEASIAPELARKAIVTCLLAQDEFHPNQDPAHMLYGGRYDAAVREIAIDRLMNTEEPLDPFGSAIAVFAALDFEKSTSPPPSPDVWALEMLNSEEREVVLYGAGALMQFLYQDRIESTQSVELVIARLVDTEDLPQDAAFMYVWAMAWAAQRVKLGKAQVNSLQIALLRQWKQSRTLEFSRFCAWAMKECPLVGQWNLGDAEREQAIDLANRWLQYSGREQSFLHSGALAILFYLTPHDSRAALAALAAEKLRTPRGGFLEFAKPLFAALDYSGEQPLLP